MHERECECKLERERVLACHLAYPHPGASGSGAGSALVRALLGVRGFGASTPSPGAEPRAPLAQERVPGCGTGTSLCSPAPHWVLGCTRGRHHRVWGVSSPQIASFRVDGWGGKPEPGAGGGQTPHPGVLLQPRAEGNAEELGWEPGSRFRRLLREEALGARGERVPLFLTDPACPPAPREQLRWPPLRFPAQGCAGAGLCCCSLHSCRGAGARGGPVPPLPRDPSPGKAHGPVPAGIFRRGGEPADGARLHHIALPFPPGWQRRMLGPGGDV